MSDTIVTSPVAPLVPPSAAARAQSPGGADASAPSFAAALDSAVTAGAADAPSAKPAASEADRERGRDRRDPDPLVALLAGALPMEARPAIASAAAAGGASSEPGAAPAPTLAALAAHTADPRRPLPVGADHALPLAAGDRVDQPAAATGAAPVDVDPAAAGRDASVAVAPARDGVPRELPRAGDAGRSQSPAVAQRDAVLPQDAPAGEPAPVAPALKPAAKAPLLPKRDSAPAVDEPVRASPDERAAPPVPATSNAAAADFGPRRGGMDVQATASAADSGSTPAMPVSGPASGAAPQGAETPARSASVLAPVGSDGWAADVAQRLVRLAPGDVELHLHPAELGPLKVKLSLAGTHAQLAFVSEHLAVRQALEAALPQLRTTFEGNGISLGQATVGSGSGEQAARDQPSQQPPRPAPAAAPAKGNEEPLAVARALPAGFDAFA